MKKEQKPSDPNLSGGFFEQLQLQVAALFVCCACHKARVER